MFQSEKTSHGVSKQKSEVLFGLSRIQTCALWVRVYRRNGRNDEGASRIMVEQNLDGIKMCVCCWNMKIDISENAFS